jgi:ubiquinone/menaquinone biosynthesis C-methylase UbiE
LSEKLKITRYYSDMSKEYDRARLAGVKNKIISDMQNIWLVKHLTGPTCLEVGCGTGRVTRRISGKVKYLVAADGSIEMIHVNKENTKPSELKKIDYIRCDASFLPFQTGCFDGVVGARVFWHVPDYFVALKEALRVLKAKNALVFDFPCSFGPFSLQLKLHRSKIEVLTKFISSKEIKTIFRRSARVTISRNTSFLLAFLPDKIFTNKTIRIVTSQLERLEFGLLNEFFFSYYLIEVTK